MKKQSFLSAILLLVFSLVLMHDVIPHHHHDDVIDITNHDHHHDHDCEQGHDHDQKDQNHSDQKDDHKGHFSHLSHVIIFTEFVFENQIRYEKQDNVDQVLLNSFDIAVIIDDSIKESPPDDLSYHYRSSYYNAHLLRGPPSLLF